jgi:hypothetical protein
MKNLSLSLPSITPGGFFVKKRIAKLLWKLHLSITPFNYTFQPED